MIRVAVTGLGAVSPLGPDVPSLWEGLLSGRSGVSPVASFDASPFGTRVAGQALSVPGGERGGRALLLAERAMREALSDAGVAGDVPEGAGLAVGSTLGDTDLLNGLALDAGSWSDDDVDWTALAERRLERLGPSLARAAGAAGPNLTLPTACAAGNYALAHAADWVRRGSCPLAIAGGADGLSLAAFVGFSRLAAMAPDVCRPFDRNRKGMLLGEGAAFLVLEPWERAVARGARIRAEFLGADFSCDAHHITAPHPQGAGAARALGRALASARLAPGDVGYVSAHGTGTPLNDKAESLALHAVLGAHVRRVPVSSIKALLGHSMGAASALEAVATVKVIEEGVVIPTWNHETPDPDCDLDVVPNAPRPARVRAAASLAFAFGGNNAVVVFGAADAGAPGARAA